MVHWIIFLRRYSNPNRVLSIQSPGLIEPERMVSEREAMNTLTQGLYERLGDFWLYLYVLEGEAYLMVQYHDRNRGLMAPPVALNTFDQVSHESGDNGARQLKLFLSDGQCWCFPYRLVPSPGKVDAAELFLSPDEEAQDFGCFIAALAGNRVRLLDFIDFQDPDGEVLTRLAKKPHG